MNNFFHLKPYKTNIFPRPEINHMHRKEWGSRPSWFDFYGCQPHHEDINNGIDHTVAYLRLIVEKEIELKGIEPRKIFIAGYSQGGAVAVYSAIMIGGDLELGAGVAFSGRVPSRANIMNLPKDYNLQTKILFCRGRLDPIISTTWFNHQIIQIQDRWPNLINVITYDDMAHVQNSKMFNDVLDFLPI